MAKIINITDKLNKDLPTIVIGDKSYPVNNSMDVVLKFEELASVSTKDTLNQAIEISLGSKTAKELAVNTWSIPNFKVLTIAILAAMQDIEYDEAEARFQKSEQN